MKSPDGKKYHANAHSDRMLEIRALNDKLRVEGRGGYFIVTPGVYELGFEEYAQIRDAIASINDFRFENDPFGEHDFGKVSINGWKIFWKIDYYDKSEQCHSPDPSDPKVTSRYLTIMLASEY